MPGDSTRTCSHYDKADRKGPKVFVGEWATREGDPTPNFGGALGDAAWMTSMERNSDLIVMHCYAPLFVNVNPGGMQWKTDLIGYNDLDSYGSPAYYAQVMFASHIGNVTPKSALKAEPDVFLPYSVTRQTETGKVYPQGRESRSRGPHGGHRAEGRGWHPARRQGNHPPRRRPDGNQFHRRAERRSFRVTGPLKDVSASFRHTFPGWSITVLELTAR